jgi:hypothetical protein
MHMLHVLVTLLVMQCQYTSSNTLPWSERKQESTLPHSEYYLLPPAIVLVGPFHGANEHG